MNASPISEKWLRAAVIGSLWASVEIIFGSFLHNLRIPLAGTLLSFMSVGLMVSFSRIWQVKGVFWRAGLICALMKSISPSAIILGPMSGITIEALLMEFFVSIIGNNWFGLLIGGMAGVWSALFHKVLTLLVLYGWDMANLYDRLVEFATRQIGLESLSGIQVLLVISGIYMVAGALAVVLGVRVGMSVRMQPSGAESSPEKTAQSRLFEYSDAGSFYVPLLFLHLLLLVLILFSFGQFHPLVWVPLIAGYLVFVFTRYRRSLRQLFRLKLWIQLILITLLASLLLKGIGSGKIFDPEGLKAGLLMNLRAILLLSAFSAISVELKNPVIKTILYRRGFSSLYKSLSLAFDILPEAIRQWSLKKMHLRDASKALRLLLQQADRLYGQVRETDRRRPVCFILTGYRGEGKTTLLQVLLNELSLHGVNVGGLIARGIHEDDGQRTGYQIEHIPSGEVCDFCHLEPESGWEQVGKFWINPEGLHSGALWLSSEELRYKDLVVIDEMGPLELSGRGWASSVDRVIREYSKPMIWTVRRKLVEKMTRKWELGEVIIWDVNTFQPEKAVKKIINLLKLQESKG